MEHLKTLVFVLVLFSFGYAIIQIIKLFGHGVVAFYTAKDPTLLVVFCVATAVILALAYAAACVANWILAPSARRADAEAWATREKWIREHEAAEAAAARQAALAP